MDDGGKSWRAVSEGLSSTHVRWLAYHPAISDLEFAGTEPSGIFVSRDGAELWQARPEVAALRDEHEWMLPYSPEAGCVRGFAFHGKRLYAAGFTVPMTAARRGSCFTTATAARSGLTRTTRSTSFLARRQMSAEADASKNHTTAARHFSLHPAA
ncbi:MAG: hypothetical protein ABI690_35275 [Chloroflexota bacterium]